MDYAGGRTSGETPPETFHGSFRITAVVRLEGGERDQAISVRVPGLVLWMMAEGDTIPVLVDDAGSVIDVDRPAIEARYREHGADLKESLRPHSVVNDLRRQVGLDREQLDDLGPALRDLASVPRRWLRAVTASDPVGPEPVEPAPPIDGVSFAVFVAVQAAIVRDRIPSHEHDQVAQAQGAPAGAWSTAQTAWMARVRSDPSVGRAFGAAYAAALQE